MKVKYLILGSGVGGLSAGAALREKGIEDFLIVDRTPSLPTNLSNGLHYLHSVPEVPFPFDFKKILLTEEVWDVKNNVFKKCANLPEMFEYSKKVMENLRHPSSIMDPGKRSEVFVPESNNMNDLLQEYETHIGSGHFIWNASLTTLAIEAKTALFSPDYLIEYEHLISTVPINKFYELCGLKSPYTFKNKTVYVTNYTTTNIVPNWLIALYISDPKFPPYRITVLNNIISMESIVPMTPDNKVIVKYHVEDLFDYSLETEKSYAWETGRIFGLTKRDREEMEQFFADRNIHLLGRFGTWNNKLLMDSTILQSKEIIKSIT